MSDTPAPRERSEAKKPLPAFVSYKLVVPVELAGVVTDTVTVHRLKVRDRLDIHRDKSSEAEKEVKLVAKSLQLSVDDVEELDIADYMAIQEILEGFFSARAQS